MSALAAVRRAILEEPASDLHRLAWADLLEERGEPGNAERAEFVRLQLELASRFGVPKVGPVVTGDAGADREERRLRRRERELRGTVGRRVMLDFGVATGGFVWTLHPNDSDYPDLPKVEFRRGFVEAITLPLEAFLSHAGAIFAAQPVTAVRLSDREPRGGYWWDESAGLLPRGNDDVPRELLRMMPNASFPNAKFRYFTGVADAHAALSRAAVAYGRNLAGLPPLGVSKP